MTERQAYAAYSAHIGGCGECRPGAGIVCDEGRRLHDAWQAEATRQRPRTIDDAVARVTGRDPFTHERPTRRSRNAGKIRPRQDR